MEEKTKFNSDKNNHIIPKKIYQNPFKKDFIYKSNKIKTKKISKINKDSLFMNSTTIKKISKKSTEKSIISQSLKKVLSTKYFNGSIVNLNKTQIVNKNDRKGENIDFKKSSAAIKQLTEIKNYVDNNKEIKSVFNKIKRKNIFGNNSNKNFRNKNYKSIKNNNNTESTLNLLNIQKFRYIKRPKMQSDLSTTFKKINLNLNYSNKATKSKRYLQEKTGQKYKKFFRNYKNNLKKNDIIYKSEANILSNRTKNKNKSKNNKKPDNSNLNINSNKISKKSTKKIFQSEKKNTEDIIKSFNYTIIANTKSANTKPTNISSFVISEKKVEHNIDNDNDNKMMGKSPLKSTYFKEHMKFIDANTNQVQIFVLDNNYNKTKESDSKFLNYELGQTNGLSFTDSIFYSMENSYKNDKNKIIECEHSLEYMEKNANEFLSSIKHLPVFQKDKNKDSYCDMTDNNLSSLDEFKNGEDINRIINLQIKLKK